MLSKKEAEKEKVEAEKIASAEFAKIHASILPKLVDKEAPTS